MPGVQDTQRFFPRREVLWLVTGSSGTFGVFGTFGHEADRSAQVPSVRTPVSSMRASISAGSAYTR
jgi:hypothetical protein